MDNRPVGVYDSGLGGLTVWREIRRQLPEESLVYLGDGKNCPYGARPADEICRLADEAVGRLVGAGCKMVVVACNTATAAAIDFLRRKYRQMPIVGMEPAVKPACLNTRSGVVGVLATARSLDGDLFRRTAARYGENIRVLTAVGEGFVELVEEDREQSPEAEEAVRRVLEPMIREGADQIVLGCTHYPFLLPVFRQVIGERGVAVVDPSPAVGRRVGQLLDQYDLRAEKAPPRITDSLPLRMKRTGRGWNARLSVSGSAPAAVRKRNRGGGPFETDPAFELSEKNPYLRSINIRYGYQEKQFGKKPAGYLPFQP